ncbi:hypothetical protein [Lysobacter terrae]
MSKNGSAGTMEPAKPPAEYNVPSVIARATRSSAYIKVSPL